MRIKSYYAPTVEEAVSTARQELGADAMLVTSRKAPLEARHLGEYEVVFAVQAPETAGPAASPAPEPAANGDRLSREVAELRQQLESMRRAIERGPAAPASTAPQSPETADLFELLTANDVSEGLARELAQAAERRAAGPRGRVRADARQLRTALAEELQERCPVEATLGSGSGQPAVVALVGPPGAGKTSTLVKLAVNYGLTARRPTVLLSADTFRVAAAEQLRSYAAILGVGFQVVETVVSLAQALEENRSKGLVLVDTPGLGFSEMEESADLARFLATRPDIDTHLAVAASMKPLDLTRVIDAYEVYRPRRILFTRLDETNSFGPILNEAVRTGKPLSFFSNGQRIPEDLETVTRERVVQLLLHHTAGRARSAA